MIRHRDFAPQVIKRGILHRDEYETFDAAPDTANTWTSESGADVITLETVMLPNITPAKSEGTADGRVETDEVMTSINQWYQFLRVWFKG